MGPNLKGDVSSSNHQFSGDKVSLQGGLTILRCSMYISSQCRKMDGWKTKNDLLLISAYFQGQTGCFRSLVILMATVTSEGWKSIPGKSIPWHPCIMVCLPTFAIKKKLKNNTIHSMVCLLVPVKGGIGGI